jgi:hypothetical protein
MTRCRGGEQGSALAVALFALVIVGALVGAVFPLATLEQRAGGNALYEVEADEAADAGPIAVLAGWAGYGFDALAVNATASLGPVALGTGSAVRWAATVTRLNDQLFLVRSVGTRLDAAGGELARREVAQVLRLDSDVASAGAGLRGTGLPRAGLPGAGLPGAGSFSSGSAGAIFARESPPAADRHVRANGPLGLLAAPLAATAGIGVVPLRYRGWARVY